MAMYIVAGYVCVFLNSALNTEHKHLTRVFDSVAFSSSVMLFVGFYEPKVMNAIGSVKVSLALNAFTGFIYSIHALFRQDRPRAR
jgi:hypothetical protein